MILSDFIVKRTTFNNNHRCRITKTKLKDVWKIKCTCGITRFQSSHKEAINLASNHIKVWTTLWNNT